MLRLQAALLMVCATALPAQYRQSSLPTVPVMPVVRVANGVKTLQHDGTAFARATQLELSGAPVTVIGGANGDPDYDLTYAFGVALLSDGRVATLSSIGNKFYLFGADGQGQRTLARPGKGPGELLRPSGAFVLPGDTIFVADDGNRSLSWFVADKGVVRSKARGTAGGADLQRANGVFRDGRVLLSSSGSVEDGVLDKITRPLATAGIVSPDGGAQIVAKIPDLEVIKQTTLRRGTRHPETHVLGFTRGAVFAVWDTNVVTGSGDGYQLDVGNSTGIVHSRLAVAERRRPATQAMRDATIDLTMQRYRNQRGEGGRKPDLGEVERIERATPYADSLPPYSKLFVTPNKTLWVLDPAVPGDAGWTATAFRNDGAIVGRLQATGAGGPVTFGDDRVVVRTVDGDGVTLTVRKIAVTKLNGVAKR